MDAKAKLTNPNGLTAMDIAEFIHDEEYRAYVHLPVLATTPHGTYTFILTDLILKDDNTFLLRLRESN